MTARKSDAGEFAMPIEFIGPEPDDEELGDDVPMSRAESTCLALIALACIAICTVALSAVIGFVCGWVLP